MALEPITRQEQIIAGKDLEPVTRMEKFLKNFGGGGGFEYDFIIKSTDSKSFTLETGTYDSIMQKLGSKPIMGKIIVSTGDYARADANCIYVEYLGEQLIAHISSGKINSKLVINQDNTVTYIAE